MPKYNQFNEGDYVSFYGKILQVWRQEGCQVWMVDGSNNEWYHPNNLIRVYPTYNQNGNRVWVTIPEDR